MFAFPSLDHFCLLPKWFFFSFPSFYCQDLNTAATDKWEVKIDEHRKQPDGHDLNEIVSDKQDEVVKTSNSLHAHPSSMVIEEQHHVASYPPPVPSCEETLPPKVFWISSPVRFYSTLPSHYCPSLYRPHFDTLVLYHYFTVENIAILL